ncbi:hypothetical protein [Posidoniimonas polymericola]|uniref:hypothetical protein n=1 Tax=Posidoniimonas polymericola TaxID=2528002 RepID=UPI0011B3D77F|nr:hypothetical protein [Posidoniimonas polymericola]
MRTITKTYSDPLDLVWLHAARKLGMQVVRSAEVNASWDGAGVLTIGTPETLDPDDSLAQMILHETCHALCEGPDGWRQPDWGLGGVHPADKVHEHAALRLQAALADQVGMRAFFASTTVFRAYYDRLPADPLAPADDPAIVAARDAWDRAKHGPWAEPLNEALQRSAEIARALEGLTTEDSLWHSSGPQV